MRYQKSQALIRLAFEMQGSAVGLSLGDIAERFAVSRRTAERMRDAVREVFPEVDEVDIGDGYKRWRIRSRRHNVALPVSVEELAALHAASQQMRQFGRDAEADILDGVAAKVRGLMEPRTLHRMEVDCEILEEAEGLALRPGPRPCVSEDIRCALRDAIKGDGQVCFTYRSRNDGFLARHKVHPYGFLHGNRHYLVAFNPAPEVADYRIYSLSNIQAVERLSTTFVRDPAFTLADYAARSFGVFQEKPYDVVWRVAAHAAADARDHMFHPSQRLEEQADGSLLVRFRAGGLLEMCWHLFTWGGAIEVIEPPQLIELMKEQMGGFRHAPQPPDDH